jgi:hypothetical protein
MNATLTKAAIASVPASMLFVITVTMFVWYRTVPAFLQRLGAG